MNPTPSPLRHILATAMATIMAIASTIAPAQTIARQPFADSTHTYRLNGTPPYKDPVCNAGFVLSGGNCVALNTGTGATQLPYDMPAGAYTNNAPFAIFLTITPPEVCYNFGVYVGGAQVAWAKDDCERSRTAVSVMVPANTSFSFGAGTGRVTALASGANWSQTGIKFSTLSHTTYVQTGVSADGCSVYGVTYFYYTTNTGDATWQTSRAESSYVCEIYGL